jgi:hypothetical protein
MNILIGTILAIMGAGIAAFWVLRIISGGLPQGIRTLDGDNYLILHIIAELFTAILCALSGIGLIMDTGWANPVGLIACGALAYSGINSLAWGLKNSKALSVIFILAIAVSLVSGIYLLAADL